MLILLFNYIGILFVSHKTVHRGGIMERFVQNVKYLLASAFSGASAVCSSVLASWLAAGLSPVFLGFHLSSLFTSPIFLIFRSGSPCNKREHNFPSLFGTRLQHRTIILSVYSSLRTLLFGAL